jgi:uncharacterized protein YaaN involved in tellurite resistance
MNKNEFNNRANEETPGSDEAAKESRQKRARGKVVDYVDADPELKAQMEKIMEPIDRAPNSFEAIITYGHPPLAELGVIANDMIRIQGKFNDQVNVMAGALDQLQNGMSGMNLEKLGENARKLLKGLGDATVKGAKGGASMVKNFFDAITGKSKKKSSEEDKMIQEMQDALPEMLTEMLKLVHNIEETDKGIIQVMKEAEKLGAARVECTRQISVYLGASKEVLRRYNEEYIPEAEAQFKETADPDDEMFFKDVVKRKEDFIDRITVLEGSRTASVIAAQQLRQIIETMEDQRKKIQDIIFNSQNEWKAMLTAAGFAGSSLKAAQALKKADDFGDKMHDQTMQMIEEAHKMTLNSKSRGTVDPAKLIDAANRLQQMIEKENEARKTRLLALEATAQQLRGATDKLIEAADSSNKARLLEAANEAKKGSEQKNEAGNDNKKVEPENEKKTGTDNAPKP